MRRRALALASRELPRLLRCRIARPELTSAQALLCVAALAVAATATVHFEEKFHKGWEDNWVVSKHKGAEAGKFAWSAGKFFNDATEDKGIQTSQDARFYGISAKFPSFSNKGKQLIIQFSVKHEQNIDCGGGYVKVFPSSLDQADMHGDSVYNLMFGPDICGPGTRKACIARIAPRATHYFERRCT